MPTKVEREKWILYKHTNNYEMIKAVALDIKNRCGTNIDTTERHRMQERLAAIDMYKTRNPQDKPLDSINHRINTLEFYMFGYEDKNKDNKRFIFSPLGNLFLKHIKDEYKLKRIFAAMLFGIQFTHPANGTPNKFQIYPFRLLFQLMADCRLNFQLFYDEYTYLIAFVSKTDNADYENLVRKILKFRQLRLEDKIRLLKEDEHCYVNCVYEWEYYTTKVLQSAGILKKCKGVSLVQLSHPSKTNSKSSPTKRTLTTGYVELEPDIRSFTTKMLDTYPCFAQPVALNSPERMRLDGIKEIYSFYPRVLFEDIGEEDTFQVQLLELPQLIEKYADNPNNETFSNFEQVLEDGFNLFVNVEALRVGGAGHTDIECKYIPKRKKFAIEAKSTANKLPLINAGRLREHRALIGGEYTIVITPRYVPAVKRDITGENIVIILAHTLSEYLYNHLYHDLREIDYADFDDIITNNLGQDISKQISNMTMEKFATK